MFSPSFQTILQPSSKPRQGTFGVSSKQTTTGHQAPSRAPMSTSDKENNVPSIKGPQKPSTEKKDKKL